MFQEVSNITSELTNELTDTDNEGEMTPATEIKLSFSPGKLTQCFAQQHREYRAEVNQNIQTFEQKQREIDE